MDNEKKKVIVLGAGKSGISATKALLKLETSVILYDDNQKLDKEKIVDELMGFEDYEIRAGFLKEDDYKDLSLCVISPGFPKFKDYYKRIKELNIPIISEIELGFQIAKGNLCAITGSNGKTTTTVLIGEILKKHYNDVYVLGNIGEPYSSKVFDMTDESITVLELSSFQLEDIVNFRPNVAAILNITPDHLDRYNKYSDYVEAKINIAANQTDKDYLILNYDDSILRQLTINNNMFKSRIVFFSSKSVLLQGIYLKNNEIFYKDNNKTIKLLNVKELKLLGTHNYENVMAAIAVTYFMGVSLETIIDVCKTFKPIEHRIEFVRERYGIKFYNDSKATNPDAAIKAIDAMDGRIILIAGGSDKGTDFGDFVSKVKEKVRYMILIGSTSKQIANKCREMGYNNVIFAESLDEAVDIANSYANNGDNILLSPACASFDMFKSYEDRGNKFKEKVNSLK